MTLSSAAYQSKMSITDSVALTTPASGTDTVTAIGNQWDAAELTLNGASNPVITAGAQVSGALSAGAATIDLRATTLNGAAVDGNGLRVKGFKIKNTGAAAMTITEGASNGLGMCGQAFSVTLPPAGEFTWFCGVGSDGIEDIDATHKTFDIAGTGTDTFRFTVLMG